MNTLKKQLQNKTIQNKEFNKKYFINETDHTVHKIARRPQNYIAYLTTLFLLEYYNNILHLPFECEIKSRKEIEYISPIVKVDAAKGYLSLEEIKETQNILDKISKEINILLKPMLKKDCYVRIFSFSLAAENYFIYNDIYYLLDFEEIYFCCYNKNNENIGLNGFADGCQEIIQEYYYAKDLDVKEIYVQENMLSINWHLM